MKRMVMACSLMAAATFLLVRCNNKRNTENNSVRQGKDTSMTRVKDVSGVEYIILKEGTGQSPEAGNYVIVHYTGWIDVNGEPGEQFDSSLDRGEPFVFPIGMGYVIEGWDQGVISMKIGEKRRLFIPSEMGYGSRGAGRSIPPHANLIFDVELLDVKKR